MRINEHAEEIRPILNVSFKCDAFLGAQQAGDCGTVRSLVYQPVISFHEGMESIRREEDGANPKDKVNV